MSARKRCIHEHMKTAGRGWSIPTSGHCSYWARSAIEEMERNAYR
jgi:hypothetical protein